MKLDWNTRISLDDQNVLLCKKNSEVEPRVTIGLPTYRRGHLICRALSAIAQQTYRDFVLVVSDNAGEDPITVAVLQKFADDLPGVVLVAQEENIGALGNFKFLLGFAETEYFMWLADDDEISPDYLEELVGLLDADPAAVTAMGQWKNMTSPNDGAIRQQLRLEAKRLSHRLIKFVGGKAEDSAFYGVHRTECLRQSRFGGYLPPNRSVLTNFCYILLFDMLWLGRFRYGRSATWVCHNYSEKEYDRAHARGVRDRLKTLLRRLNVYAIYIGKTGRRAPMLVPVVLFASIVGLTREIVSAAWRLSGRALRHRMSIARAPKTGG